MARHQTPEQQATVSRVMHEFKHGELTRGRGGKVKNPRQAIAIALSEAGASNQQSTRENRKHLKRTKAKERRGQTAQAETEGRGRARRTLREAKERRSHSRRGERTRKELYQEAAKRGIKGRSQMNKAQLERALHR